MIDEYDNFTNTLLAQYGYDEYRKITKHKGYFKEFFTTLKALASGSGAGLAKMFITGVSPITMNDVTSGMNIGNNITTDETFNEIMGFIDHDVEEIIDYYTSVGVFHLDKEEITARIANVEIDSPCGGKGTCGKCIVRITSGEVDSDSLGVLMESPWM